MHFGGNGFFGDGPEEEEEGEQQTNSLDIMPEAHNGTDQNEWMSSALDSMDESTDIMSISFSGGRLSSRIYEKVRDDISDPDSEAPDEPASPDNEWKPPQMSVDDGVALQMALQQANAQPGVELVVLVDKNGTLLFDQAEEDAALLGAFVPLFGDSMDSPSDLFESLADEIPRFEGCRIKMQYVEHGSGGWCVCAVGLPSCDLDGVIAKLIGRMKWLLR